MTDTGPDTLPPDSHVHSEWSWDALAGSMEGTCRRAVEIGLPAIAFTEHADFTAWSLRSDDKIPDEWRHLVSDGVLTPPALDLGGYQDCLRHCRERFPGLRILSGVELSEPHWHRGRAAALLHDGGFDRVLRDYLAEAAALISGFDASPTAPGAATRSRHDPDIGDLFLNTGTISTTWARMFEKLS